MSADPAHPEECLRGLTAAALLRARPERDLLPVSLGLQATANAFVMLGLLPEEQAEDILAGHRTALEDKGISGPWGVDRGELTVRPGAHRFWVWRQAGSAGLREIPLAVAPAGIRCATPAAEVDIGWVTATPAGLRLTFEGAATDPGGRHPPRPPVDQAVTDMSVTDDGGHRYELTATGAGGFRGRDRREWRWHGQLAAEPGPAWPPAWLEFGPVRAGPARRVGLAPPAGVLVGRSDPPWPAPAEGYLAELARVTSYSINGAEVGPQETAEIVATVADSLMAVGALPASSAWLRGAAGAGEPGWHAPLVSRWGRRAHQGDAGFRSAGHRGLAARLPFEHATAVIEGVSARGELVSIRLYGHPWVMGEYWPMITPCFAVRAVDDAGQEHDGVPGDWQGFPGGEGRGTFWFWPPVGVTCSSLRLTVSTLWEAAWAEVPLSR